MVWQGWRGLSWGMWETGAGGRVERGLRVGVLGAHCRAWDGDWGRHLVESLSEMHNCQRHAPASGGLPSAGSPPRTMVADGHASHLGIKSVSGREYMGWVAREGGCSKYIISKRTGA